jgi:hypothetical protein
VQRYRARHSDGVEFPSQPVCNAIQLANGKCGRMIGNKRCKGTNSSANQENDWGECPSCAGSGSEGAKQCSQCEGPGWLFIRGRRL